MSILSIYYFNSSKALQDATNCTNQNEMIFFYDGELLNSAPSNCINVPISTFFDYFLKTTYPQISQLNFDKIEFSDEIKSQITQSITETIQNIKNQKIEIINNVLQLEINEQRLNIIVYALLKQLYENLDDDGTIKIIIKLLEATNYLKEHSHNFTYAIDELALNLSLLLQNRDTNMQTIQIAYIISILQKEQSFQEIELGYLNSIAKYRNFAEVFSFFYYIEHIFPRDNFTEYINKFAKVLFTDDFYDLETLEQKERVYKFFYCNNILYSFAEDFKEMYKIMYPIFLKAIEKELDELVMFIYYPLQYSWNGVSQTQKEHKEFNNEVELKLESFIKNKLIKKYEIKPNTKKIEPNQKKIKVAFIQERIINYSIEKVFYSLIKSLKENNKYEFIIYDLNFMELLGSDQIEVEKLKKLGIKYVNLHQEYFNSTYVFYPIVEKCLKIHQRIINDNIDILIGMHTRAEYNFLFTTRTAPKQIYWSHGNYTYDIENIDLKIMHGSTNFEKKQMEEYNYIGFNIQIDQECLSLNRNEIEILNQRNLYPKETIILGTIGRLIKIDNIEYLETIIEIMQKNKHSIYLACGSGDKKSIINKIKNIDSRILDRFYFTGHINTDIYGYIIDIMPDTFPFNQGNSKVEAGIKGCAIVVKAKQDEKRPIDINLTKNIQKYYPNYEGKHMKTNLLYINFISELIQNKPFLEYWKEWNKKNYLKNYVYSSSSFTKVLKSIQI